MSKGTVTLLVIVFVVCISCGAGYAAYRIVREKLRRLSRMAFGTDSITEGLEQQAKELAVTPKSVSAMTRIFLPQIQRDFPDFHIEQFKDKVENALMLALQAISAADAGIFERQIKDGVSEEFLVQIKNRIRENETEAVTEHYEQIQIHQTEIANYEKKQGTCVITFQSAVGYLHYCEKAGKVLSGSKELTEQTRYNVSEKEKQLEQLSREVSDIRKKESKKLTESIKNALLDLNFLDVQFMMEFAETDYTANGIDDAQFLISTNPGEPVKPLGKVASGGELSRIMLAIKTVMASDKIGTLIFDEIDSGISGRTAQMVSEKMNALGRSHQIICITHLPQIAAMADSHFLIEKSVENQATVSKIHKLTDEESVEELARMLGGVEITDTVLENAREMKQMAYMKK